MPAPLSPDRLRFIETLLDEGWSFEEIHRTHGHRPETIRKYFPGRAWTITQRNEHTNNLRKLARIGWQP